MEIPVLVEPFEGGFRARRFEPGSIVAEGASSQEAVEHLREMLYRDIGEGAYLTAISLPGLDPRIARLAGDLKDEPLLEEWKEALVRRRREIDEDPDAL